MGHLPHADGKQGEGSCDDNQLVRVHAGGHAGSLGCQLLSGLAPHCRERLTSRTTLATEEYFYGQGAVPAGLSGQGPSALTSGGSKGRKQSWEERNSVVLASCASVSPQHHKDWLLGCSLAVLDPQAVQQAVDKAAVQLSDVSAAGID